MAPGSLERPHSRLSLEGAGDPPSHAKRSGGGPPKTFPKGTVVALASSLPLTNQGLAADDTARCVRRWYRAPASQLSPV